MANKLQKLIYNLSAAAPLCMVLALIWYIQEKTYKFPIVLVIIGTILILALNYSFSYAKKNLAPTKIRTSEISPNDGWMVAYVISYIFPFSNMVIAEFDLLLCSIISFLLIIIAPCVNTAIPNPILFVRGYHFYQINAENGISGYVLISKRRIRRKQDLSNVNRVFEFLLLDVEGRN